MHACFGHDILYYNRLQYKRKLFLIGGANQKQLSYVYVIYYVECYLISHFILQFTIAYTIDVL